MKAWGTCHQSTVLAGANIPAWLPLSSHKAFQEIVPHSYCTHTEPDLPERMFGCQQNSIEIYVTKDLKNERGN